MENLVATGPTKLDLGRAVRDARLRNVEQVELPVVHRFTPGLYARELSVPAGTAIVTQIHRTEHPFVISKGTIRVWTEDGGIVDLSAPYTGITKPGTQRVALALTDVVWTTFHPTTTTDLVALERELVVDPVEFLEQQEKLCLSSHSQSQQS